MNKPIIIDGVDVSGCNYFKNKEHTRSMCIKSKNCLYKQLQRLKAENEELKRKNTILELVTEPQRQEIGKYIDKALQLKQALEEVREIAQHHINNCCMLESCYYKEECGENCYPKTSGKVEYCCYENIGQILDKINEVLKDE